MQQARPPLDFSPEVEEALESKLPIVALESTIITHGMEYPTNVQTALDVEKQIRDAGAVPATIAIIHGRIKVHQPNYFQKIGLSEQEIEMMGKEKHQYTKCSRRDLAYIISKRGYGSTTVAATMICAHWAGIRVFVTGGIGGVHRGAETNFDISADLTELGKTPVVVVSAGAKSILDIPKTLEYLETQGVPVVGYQTIKFPEFFTSDSGQKCSHEVATPQEAAQLIITQYDVLKLQTGMLVAVPVPKEQEADGLVVKKAVDEAIAEAQTLGIQGAEITPFLLKRINELSQGDSSRSNIALIKNNARVGASIAVAVSKLQAKKFN